MPKKKTAKKSVAKAETKNKNIMVNGKEMTTDKYRESLLKQLKDNRKDVKLCKRIRHTLRTKCAHFGGLRNRTYVDKTTGVKHNVDQK